MTDKIPAKAVDISKEPYRKYCDSVRVAYSKDIFLLGMQSGGDMSAFVLTPDHAKQLARLLQTKVAEYEKAHAKLEGRLPTDPMLSPIQVKKPPEEPPTK